MKEKLKHIKAALAGNPNSGKTSLFNGLVGAHMKVGNWAGVTVEKFEGYVRYKGYKITFTDLPGTYSLTAYSPEEVIARNYIIDEKPDVVVNVVDGTNLERNLYLTTQLMELEADMVMALNMYDEVKASGLEIDVKQLQVLFGCHIVPTNAVKKEGLNSLLDHIIRVYEKDIIVKKNKLSYDLQIEGAVDSISNVLREDAELAQKYPARWMAVKLLEADQLVYNQVTGRAVWLNTERVVKAAIAGNEDAPGAGLRARIASDRYAFVRGAVKETVKGPLGEKKSITDYIDAVLINRFLGLPVFLVIMWMLFQFTFKLGEAPMGWIESFFAWFGAVVKDSLPDNELRSVISDGIIAGVGGVVVFLPNILLLFLGLTFLEATGYMARAAFVVDKVFHRLGLHGKSFIPMVTGFGCSVPAFMACRTLKNRGDRLATMMVIPFMSCGAKLPVYILIIGAFIPEGMRGNALFGIYLFGILVAALSAKLFKSTIFKGESEPFVMELPVYRLPTAGSILVQMWIKAWMYLKKAGTVILAASVIIWFAGSYPKDTAGAEIFEGSALEAASLPEDERQEAVNRLENELAARQLEHSFAGRAGKAIEPVIKPLGFDWKLGVALIAGLAAKEVVVSTMGTIYALGDTGGDVSTLTERLKANPDYTLPMALSLLVFVLLYVPCIAATAVFHKEAGELKWTLFYIAYSLTTAWVFAFLVYRTVLVFSA
ncbi:MAG TPA: ferrous iron transport protein B [bacterium]|nr:ferrous iron transport protein B [bacterium]